jgi:hypothetical protein
MRDLLIVGGMIVAALAVGAVLFFFGPSSFRAGTGTASAISIDILKQGTNAFDMTQRANYHIQNQEQLNELWKYVQTSQNTTPSVDFTKNDVLAIFDGSHSSGGFSIQVLGIEDKDGIRTVHVRRTVPGPKCSVSEQISSPYQVVLVPKSDLTLSHVDEIVTNPCP